MNYIICKGKHYAFPPRLGLYFRPVSEVKKIIFDDSCAYTLPGEDQDDINKLFGVGFFPHHHKNSARFGWNYSPKTGDILITAYYYLDGTRWIHELCHVPLNTEIELGLLAGPDMYAFGVFKDEELLAEYSVTFETKKSNIGFKLGPYFGGTYPAPQDIKIKLWNS